jgi:hypothetical protein
MQMGIQIPGVSSAMEIQTPTLAQQLTQLGHDDASKLKKAYENEEKEGEGEKDDESELENVLGQMSLLLEDAKEFLKLQKKPLEGSKRANTTSAEQDEQDMNWISGDDFTGVGKKKVERPPATAADKKMLADFNTFKSAFGSRGLPFTLPSTEYMPAASEGNPLPLAVIDKNLKYIVLLLMQETLYAGMLQDWEQTLGGSSSLKLLQDTLSILSLAKDLTQADIKTMLRVKESGLGEAWKRIWGTLHECLGCTSRYLLPFLHSALRLAVERRYILSSARRDQEGSHLAPHQPAKAGHAFAQELGGDWAKFRFFVSRSLASLEAGFAREPSVKPELPTGVIKTCIIIARFLGDSGQFREADVLFDRARILAIKGGNKSFCAEVSLYCAELLNKWSASDPAYSVDTMARSAEYASQAAQLYESIDIGGDGPSQEKFSQALYWKGLNYSTLCRLGGTDGCSAETACSTAREALDKCLALRKEFKAPAAKVAEVQFARGVLTFCMAEALGSGHIYRGIHGNGTRAQAAQGLYHKAMDLFQEVYDDWRNRLGVNALETVKAITMLCTVSNKLDGPKAALEWSKLEVQVREEVQGTLHPRTQQAKRNHANLLEALAAQNARQRSTGDTSGGGNVDMKKPGDDLKDETGGSKRQSGGDGGTSRMQQLISLVDEEAKEAAAPLKRKDSSDSRGDADDASERKKRAKKEDVEGEEVSWPWSRILIFFLCIDGERGPLRWV